MRVAGESDGDSEFTDNLTISDIIQLAKLVVVDALADKSHAAITEYEMSSARVFTRKHPGIGLVVLDLLRRIVKLSVDGIILCRIHRRPTRRTNMPRGAPNRYIARGSKRLSEKAVYAATR